MFDAEIPIASMSVSALTKYALGDPDESIRFRGCEILEKSIKLAGDLGVRYVMIPGYDIYYGESTEETKKLFVNNIACATQIAARDGVMLAFETMENEFMNTVTKGISYTSIVNSPYLKLYPDTGNITNAAVLHNSDVIGDMLAGKGNLVALHLKESKPGVFREVPYFMGHVQFESLIKTA